MKGGSISIAKQYRRIIAKTVKRNIKWKRNEPCFPVFTGTYLVKFLIPDNRSNTYVSKKFRLWVFGFVASAAYRNYKG